jgi:hypothetical protein
MLPSRSIYLQNHVMRDDKCDAFLTAGVSSCACSGVPAKLLEGTCVEARLVV